APTEETWHAPLAGRSELSLRAMKRISGFIASYLVSEMVDRHELKGEAAEELLQAARAKINGESVDDALWDEWRASAEALYAQGQIDDALIRTYVKDNKRGLITHCLAICADISAKDAASALTSKSGKLITALAWKAGLSMRTAVTLQRSIALMNARDVVYAKDGFDYPFEEKDMDWQLASHVSE
ncbi:MAG: DUF2336 domain-containing protein, partial [Pseudomonadota bacterium]